MEHWLHDCPDHPRELFREFIINFYQENKLVKNKIKIGRRTVNLKHISMPVFNIYGQYDHLAPPHSTMQLGNYLGTADYQTLSFNSGHIGVFVSSFAQQQIPDAIVTWLEKHYV
jgi:polyhydroxyalkanoate synthase